MKPALTWAAALVGFSWVMTWIALSLGPQWVTRGDGYPKSGEVQSQLFRFDSVYYKEIAETGYAYNGDPFSSPNIVFAPLFPIMVAAMAELTGLDTVGAGFALNVLLLWISTALLFLFLESHIGRRRALFVLLAFLTSAGSYSFRAFYSESCMLLGLSVVLLAWERRWPWALLLTGMALGASRLAAVPALAGVAAAFFITCTQRLQRPWRFWPSLLGALSVGAGAASYLGFLAWNYGEPLALLNTIQKSSWGRFHPDSDWIRVWTGSYLLDYAEATWERGWAAFFNIQSLNLFWMILAALAAVHLLVRWRRHPLAWIYVPYFLFVYHSNAASDYLISAHRLFAVMLPIFLMWDAAMAKLAPRSRVGAWVLTALLLAINLAYGMVHTVMFNQGQWFWF